MRSSEGGGAEGGAHSEAAATAPTPPRRAPPTYSAPPQQIVLRWETLALVAAVTTLAVLLPASFADRGHWQRAASRLVGGSSGSSSSASGGAAVLPSGSGGAAHTGGAPIDGAASADALPDSDSGAASGTLACQLSGYCSRGKVKAWRGDVATNDALKEAVASLAYKSEVGVGKRCGVRMQASERVPHTPGTSLPPPCSWSSSSRFTKSRWTWP